MAVPKPEPKGGVLAYAPSPVTPQAPLNLYIYDRKAATLIALRERSSERNASGQKERHALTLSHF